MTLRRAGDPRSGKTEFQLVALIWILLRRVALECRQFVSALHPSDPFGNLDVRTRRHGVGIVIGRALDIDDPRQHLCVHIEKSGAAIGAEMPPAMFRRCVDLGCALRHFDRGLRVHRPADHRRAGVAPAIRAMAQRVDDCLAFSLIADCAAMAAAGNHGLLSFVGPTVEAAREEEAESLIRSRRCAARRKAEPFALVLAELVAHVVDHRADAHALVGLLVAHQPDVADDLEIDRRRDQVR